LLREFPQLADDLDDFDDLPHMQLGVFATLAQRAKGAADWDTYERCVDLAHRFLAGGDTELRGALSVAYLEHIDFAGPRGARAWEALTPQLQAACKQITAANEARLALPKKKPKRKHT
jgi:hypothetical protein